MATQARFEHGLAIHPKFLLEKEIQTAGGNAEVAAY